MWISDWANKSEGDDQGCRQRQREQTKKAKALVAKMKTQGWKMIPMNKTQQVLIDNYKSVEKAIANHDKDIKKKWGQKKVKMYSKRPVNASDSFLITENIMEYEPSVKSIGWGELGGYSALLNKGNEYRIIFTYGSDDDESGFWSKPVTQLAFKSTASKPKAKAPARKPAAKPRKTTTNKVMTKAEAKKKFIALAQPYWIKSMTSIKQMFEKEEKKYPEGMYEDWYEPPSKVANKYLKMAKSGRFRALEWDYSDLVPDGFYHLINYDRNDYDTWETTAAYFEGPKATAKQLKSLLPFIEGKVTKTVVKPKPKPRAKAPAKKPVAKPRAKAKARPSPSQSAAATKVGVRKRGNDGSMWEVKKSKNGVHRWVRDSKSTKRAEDYWY